MATQLSEFSQRVTSAVKAELARQNLNGLDLVAPLGLSRNSIYERLRYNIAFSLDEIATISNFLQIPVGTLVGTQNTNSHKNIAA